VRVVLLSRAPLPPREGWADHLRAHAPFEATARRIAAVQRLEALGAEVLPLAADVCNLQEMQAALAAATARFGRIDAVLHAAGTVDDAPILAKAPAAIEAVLAPKLHGTQVLLSLLPDGATDLIVLFSSTSTVTAPAGQADYVAANEYLNALAQSRAGGRTRVVAIDWGVWAEVGMAAEAVAERTGARPEVPVVPARQPLLEGATFDARGNRLFTARLDARAAWVLDEHRMPSGDAVLPGTAYLELAAEALAAQGEAGPFEIRDLTFFRPVQAGKAGARDLRLRLVRSDEGYRFELRSDVSVDGRRGFALNAQATLALAPGTAPGRLDLAALEARCPDGRAASETGLPSPQERHLAFGPRWRVLRSVATGAGEGVARLALAPAFRGDLAAGYRLHPALMDIATGWAMGLIPGWTPSSLWVPVAYARVQVLRPLPAEIVSHVRLRDGGADAATFDVTLAAASGEVCVVVEGFSLHRLAGTLSAEPPRPDPREVEFAEGGPAHPLSPGEERLRETLALGIRPAEGAEAFARALATGLPQVVVSSIDLPALRAQADAAVPEPAAEGAGFERPDLDSAYVAPRNDIERTLAGFWSELLGVAQVGVEDDFFALGGHSLIAVRLFAMIRKSFRVDFPISVLFEAPTIARCAALIAERIGGLPEDGAAPAPGAPARRFTHLVPMHEGEGGPRTPFFLVAGMFGNVLNLRHLAGLIGTDRPFFGLQAKGLMGGEAPHETLPEAAASCIAEMRQVQAQGPWLVGGFSGGGLTAWEIARQLEAAGERVALLVLLDTPLPVRPALTWQDKALIKLAEFRRKGPGYLAEWARARLAWEMRRRSGKAGPEAEGSFHNAAIEAAFRAALPRYEMAPWGGNAVLFRPPLDRHWRVSGGRWVSRQKEYVSDDNDLGRLAPALRVFEVPGDHDTMVLEPNVRVLAARLRALIAEAEAAPFAPPAPFARAAE
jgi:thioesterase domain-containing protein/acyl carrier protein